MVDGDGGNVEGVEEDGAGGCVEGSEEDAEEGALAAVAVSLLCFGAEEGVGVTFHYDRIYQCVDQGRLTTRHLEARQGNQGCGLP